MWRRQAPGPSHIPPLIHANEPKPITALEEDHHFPYAVVAGDRDLSQCEWDTG